MQDTRPAGTARERVLGAALDLFAEYGVSGTSLQMIADRLGVTKAAVYHQFPTKDEIVQAVIHPALDRLDEIADEAEAKRGRGAQVRAVLAGVVGLVVEHRRLSAVFSFDPAVAQLVRREPAIRSVERINRLLTGPDPDDATRVAVAMVSGGLIVAGIDPDLTRLDDDAFREHLVTTALRTLGVRR